MKKKELIEKFENKEIAINVRSEKEFINVITEIIKFENCNEKEYTTQELVDYYNLYSKETVIVKSRYNCYWGYSNKDYAHSNMYTIITYDMFMEIINKNNKERLKMDKKDFIEKFENREIAIKTQTYEEFKSVVKEILDFDNCLEEKCAEHQLESYYNNYKEQTYIISIRNVFDYEYWEFCTYDEIKELDVISYKDFLDIINEKEKMNKREIIFKNIVDKMYSVYKAKNKDYGNSFTKVRSEFDNAICIRVCDKTERLKTLKKSDSQNVKDESIEDTLMDLANYCILELIEMQLDKENK